MIQYSQYSIIKSNIIQKDKIHDSAKQYHTVWYEMSWKKIGYGTLQQNNIDPEGSYCMTARTLYKNLTKYVNTQGKKKKITSSK